MTNSDHEITKTIKEAWNSPYLEVSNKSIDHSWENFKSKLPQGRRKKHSIRLYKYYGAAAVFIALIAGYFFFSLYNPITDVYNDALVDKEVILPDGTLVLLKNNSSISYPENFETRDVNLKGEAFFDVVRDTLRRFQVKTKATTTTVLGTSFNVKSEEGLNDATVSLFSGRVLVSVKNRAESWALIPGESFVYKKGRASVERFETILSFEAGNKFIDVNYVELDKVIEFLEKRYGYEFEMGSIPGYKRVTLRINRADSLEQILNVLSIINNTDYEMNPTEKKVKLFRKKKESTTIK
ncbi:MAG: FecR domain-containing protein [Salinimicrobium sp.]